MAILLKIWFAWVAFLLPVRLIQKIRHALIEPNRSTLWRTGRVMFFLGILVWCPYVLVAKLLRVWSPLPAVIVIHTVCLYGGLLILYIAHRRAGSPTGNAPMAANS